MTFPSNCSSHFEGLVAFGRPTPLLTAQLEYALHVSRMPSQRLKVSIAAIDMVFGLLHVEESRRLGTTHFHSIQHHPWFEGFDWVALLRREVTPPYVPRADLILPDVSDRLCPSVMTADDFDRQAWAHIFDEFGPMAKLHGE